LIREIFRQVLLEAGGGIWNPKKGPSGIGSFFLWGYIKPSSLAPRRSANFQYQWATAKTLSKIFYWGFSDVLPLLFGTRGAFAYSSTNSVELKIHGANSDWL
jgi:hypothetical protein